MAIIALPLALLQAGCDSGPGEPPAPENRAPTAQISASATDVRAGEAVTFDASSSTDSDGTIASYDWTLTAPAESDVSLSVTDDQATLVADVAGEYEVELTVTDDDGARDNAAASVAVDMPAPDNVTATLTLEAADGDSLVTTDVTFAGETVAEDFAEGEFTLPFSEESGTLCALEMTFFDSACVDVTPDADFEDELALARKTVELDVSVEPSDADVVVLDRDGQTLERVGSFVADVRKLSGDREVTASAEGYESETEAVAADADQTLSFDLVEIPPAPACSDGVDNEGDGLIDADDFGCLSPDGEYEPEDDNEEHRVFTRGSSKYFRNSENISSLEDNREFLWYNFADPLPRSVEYAIGEIIVSLENRREIDQDGEEFALRFETGTDRDNILNVNTTEIVPDLNEQNGFDVTPIHGVNRSYYANGGHQFYEVFVEHASKVRGDPPGDGDDDVILHEGEPGLRDLVLSYAYDPDNVPGAATATQPQSLSQPLEVGACRETASGEVCKDVVPEWLDR